MPVDLLAFGPHPDDIEIGLGATIAKHVALGRSVGLCDLTRGELGTNGTPDERLMEAEAARLVLGAAWRENLGWPDGGIGDDERTQIREAVALIRRAQPRVVAIPWGKDRHPDHVDASRVLTKAVFRSGLARYDAPGDRWRPERTVYYFINDSTRPSFVVDVSDHYAIKREALACHRTQLQAAPGSVETRLTRPTFKQLIESRDAQFGALIGAAFAEGFVTRTLLQYPHL